MRRGVLRMCHGILWYACTQITRSIFSICKAFCILIFPKLWILELMTWKYYLLICLFCTPVLTLKERQSRTGSPGVEEDLPAGLQGLQGPLSSRHFQDLERRKFWPSGETEVNCLWLKRAETLFGCHLHSGDGRRRAGKPQEGTSPVQCIFPTCGVFCYV